MPTNDTSVTENLPTEYNELLELIESNDASVVASIILNNYTPNTELRAFIEETRDQNSLIKSISGHGRSARAAGKRELVNDLERLIDSQNSS